jgi:aminoglycoside/choline kinase family phosphotransferase
VTTPPDPRRALAVEWLAREAADLDLDPATLAPASSDASFRRYFRVASARGGTLILMDAPPGQEDCRPFVHVQQVLAAAGVNVPRLVRADVDAGFLLLGDFGDTTYLSVLDGRSAPALYADATRSLVRLQLASRPGVFPPYDRALLLREMMLFPDWYLARHKGLQASAAEREVIGSAFDAILARTVSQPAVFVHRDYHSRNLMRLDGPDNPGVLDFQDAVYGPVTYDLVSLLRDAYISWDEERVLDLAIRYWEQARSAGLPVADDISTFYTDFEWMGLQRHLKVLGIFARLCHRDGKRRYLDDLPRVLDYTLKVLRRYVALAPLCALVERIEERVPEQRLTF